MNSNDLMQTEQEWLQEYEDTQSAAHHSEELNQQRRTQMASSYDQEDNVLIVYLQDERSNPKAPSYTGKGLAWGKATRAAVWHNVSKNGKDYLKIKLEEPRDSAPSPEYTKKPASDIPF